MPMGGDGAKKILHVPRNALSRVHLGHSFAEYDLVRDNPQLIVTTPAIQSALSTSRTKCFFVGRRGTGKTAITYSVSAKTKNCLRLVPGLISPIGDDFDVESFRDPKQRPFKTLVSCFRRAIYGTVLEQWEDSRLLGAANVPRAITKELRLPDHEDFDLNLLSLFESVLGYLNNGDEKNWLKAIKNEQALGREMEGYREDAAYDYTVLIDSIDESWDGTDKAVIYLMALMHACVELSARSTCIRPLLFLRENVFDRVRELDTEFARLETWLVSLEWTDVFLQELIERRLNFKLNPKLSLRGPTWRHFFEDVDATSSWSRVADFCQRRPRDVLTYCEFAIEIAQTQKHTQVTIEDMQAARRRFSDNRLKDIADEYSENYPNIGYVLNCFFGLGNVITINGLTAFIEKLIVDAEVQHRCAWVFNHAAPERFAELLYNIGFLGLQENEVTKFRGLGSTDSKAPAITSSTRLVIHPTFATALNTQNVVIDSLAEDWELRQTGIVLDVPEAICPEEYYQKLLDLHGQLALIREGKEDAAAFEDLVGDVIKYCFFQWLGNVEAKSRTVDGTSVRDWVASNTASGGFWEAMRQRYNALNVIWECKNYSTLHATDFHQANYYISSMSGLVIIAYRGTREAKKHCYAHIKNVAASHNGNAIVLLVNDQDLATFIRQAQRGKFRDSHIREIYDNIARAIA
jgi:hypothetical protein